MFLEQWVLSPGYSLALAGWEEAGEGYLWPAFPQITLVRFFGDGTQAAGVLQAP